MSLVICNVRDGWSKAAPFLEEALEGDKDWSIDDLRVGCERGDLTLWLGLTDEGNVFGSAVTCVMVYPKRKTMHILAMGSEPKHEDDWVDAFRRLKRWAHNQGMSAITGQGRRGWARKLGATEHHVFEVEL